jgi:hypothetical protein
LILSSIRFFPHRTINMTFSVTSNLRWQLCSGNGAPSAVFTGTSRDRESAVSFFRTRQAALQVHLRSGLRFDCPTRQQKDEAFVKPGRFS